jgi:hypothetical protein
MVLVFSTTLFLSAALLMSIQPLFAKAILPLFGGAPQVWNICMMFYQVLLLGGYLFAHWSSRLGRKGIYLQLGLIALPLLMLPIANRVIPGSDFLITRPASALLWVLVSSVALPFFVLSTLSPLLQRWLSYTTSKHAEDPYFLYAASNLGSFLGLLSYPLWIEPLWTTEQQSAYWAMLYGVLMVGVMSCAVVVLRQPDLNREKQLNVGGVDWRRSGLWLLLAFIPSSAMHAVSMHIVSEVASIPLLWVLPLGIYLLSMVLCFARHQLLPHHWLVSAAPGVVLLVLLLLVTSAFQPIGLVLSLHMLGLFVVCQLFHGELARRRPGSEDLTWFYIVLAVGGAMGGIFNSLLAPTFFDSIVEYPAILLLAVVLLPARSSSAGNKKMAVSWGLLPPAIMLFGFGLFEWLQTAQAIGQPLLGSLGKVVVLVLPFLGCYLLLKNRAAFSLATLCCVVLGYWVNTDTRVIHAQRTFFGVHTVLQAEARQQTLLMNGITVHGIQNTAEEIRGLPATYYHPTGPAGQLLGAFGGGFQQVAVVGLGAGSLAAYFSAGQRLDFFEIDSAVIDIAESTHLFSFVSDARTRGVGIEMIAGDARLTLAQKDGGYDALLVDAFSSGSIPVHLMTAEAIALYLNQMSSDGVLGFHISNHYLDFKDVLCDLAANAELACLYRTDTTLNAELRSEGKSPSEWLVMTTNSNIANGLLSMGWQLRSASEKPLWRDNYSNIFDTLM